MMEQKAVRNRKIARYAILVGIFLAAAMWSRQQWVNRGVQAAYLGELIQEALHEKEHRAEAILSGVIGMEQEDVSFDKIYDRFRVPVSEIPDFALLVYQKDSLVFWSENRVPATISPRDDLPAAPFCRHGNGWYRVIRAEKDQLAAFGLILIKSDYPYQNDFLHNAFAREFNVPEGVQLDTARSGTEILSRDGTFLFSLVIPENTIVSDRWEMLPIAFGILAFASLLILLFHLYCAMEFMRKRPLLLMAGFLIDALILRGLFLYFRWPGFIYDTALFGPFHFASSAITPSLGDFLVNSIFWLILALLFYEKAELGALRTGKSGRQTFWMIAPALAALLFLLLGTTVHRLVLDSSLELDFNELFRIDTYSGIGLLGLTSLVLAYFLFTAKLITQFIRAGIRTGPFIITNLLYAFIVAIIVFYRTDAGQAVVSGVFLAIYLNSFLYFSHRSAGYRDIAGALFFIVLFSVVTTIQLDIHHAAKEKDNRMVLASELASRRDPLMEFEFAGIREEIMEDTVLQEMARAGMDNNAMDDSIITWVQQKYFNALWNKYDLVLTVCRPEESLNIRPAGYIANCYEYFDAYFHDTDSDSIGPGLYFIHSAPAGNSYIARFEFTGPGNSNMRLFAELYYKYYAESGLGYPDLLMDKNISVLSGLSDYAYARYLDGRLIYKNGDFAYRIGFDAFDRADEAVYFIDYESFSHLVMKHDARNVLIISKKNTSLLGWVAPFSYLFILFTVFLLLFLGMQILRRRIRRVEFSFGNQMQFAVIFIIVIAFIILGIITRSNIIHLYDEKNRDNLNEKTLSVLTEMEHKIGDMAEIPEEMQPYLYDLLYKFSLIFFSDINMYDPSGTLIATSRPQIFDEELISRKIQPDAFQSLTRGQSLIHIQEERIGEQVYLSAYMPFRNNDDRIIAYLNLPYFAKQTELRKELADFLSAYINVYVLLIVLAVVITILVSRLITRPLALIREKLGHIALGKANEKIEWERKDEIGGLVEEYNRMIDELARSAELLAQSERESAWREMARQVAHEIKNPLTPMKLSVQYLQKAWNEQSPDFEKRLQGFTRTIIEQIDALSEIASEFSDFAKMPVARLEKIDLSSIIRTSTDLYHHAENVRFELEFPSFPCFVKADRKQLLRVFNNLIQNAIEAIGEKSDGKIRIRVSVQEAHYRVEVTDNGSGITEEQSKRIFSPSFTTKSSGMGLGLAMVRSILTSIGGTVSFESEAGNGATFLLLIPQYSD